MDGTYDSMHAMWSRLDRKSTRLNSSHPSISYAVFCLKKKKPPHGVPGIIHDPPEARTRVRRAHQAVRRGSGRVGHGRGAGVRLAAARVFLFNDPATTETYTLSLHDALPI